MTAPTTPSDRLTEIDILRGLALFGVLAINLVTEFRVSIFEQFLPPMRPEHWLDGILDKALAITLSMKAFALFSFLFGIGLAIQFDHLANNPRRMTLLLRRLSVLLAFGLIHLCLIWNGDILVEYAFAGLIVLPMLFASGRVLIGAGLFLLGLYVVAAHYPPILLPPSRVVLLQHVLDATRVYGTGTFSEILWFRLHEIPAIVPLHLNVFPRTLGLMLLGAGAWRVSLFANVNQHARAMATTALLGIWLGASLCTTVAFKDPGGATFALERLGAVVLATGYGAAILWLARTSHMLDWAAPIGRMAFTNYITQSIVCGLIFYGYGYGLGLFGQLGAASAFALAIAIYATQVIISRYWLDHYRFGPIEWLWRSSMYGTRQPMRLR